MSHMSVHTRNKEIDRHNIKNMLDTMEDTPENREIAEGALRLNPSFLGEGTDKNDLDSVG